MKLKTGSWILDSLTGGYWGVTTFYGQPGSGISTILMTAVVEHAKDKVFFIDTENSFNPDRFLTLKGSNKKLLETVYIAKPKTIYDQSAIIAKLVGVNSKLIIVDSITKYCNLCVDKRLAQIELDKQLRVLHDISMKTPVILVTSCYTNIDTGKVIMSGGDILKYYSNILIEVKKLKNASRAMMHKPGTMKQVLFKITESGLEQSGGN